jgi:para-nitrobenzyl esterase
LGAILDAASALFGRAAMAAYTGGDPAAGFMGALLGSWDWAAASMSSVLFTPVVDGNSLPLPPGEAIAAGASADVPVVIGTTRHEYNGLAFPFDGLPDVDEATMRAQLRGILGDRLDDTLDVFRRANPGVSTTELTSLVASAAMFRKGSLDLADRKVSGGDAPVYVYMLTWRSPVLGGRLGAPHGMCVPLTMDNAHLAAWSDVPAGHELAAQMSAAWIAFARRGEPSHPGLPRWEPYEHGTRATMLFDDPCELRLDPFGDERAPLDGLPRAQSMSATLVAGTRT